MPRSRAERARLAAIVLCTVAAAAPAAAGAATGTATATLLSTHRVYRQPAPGARLLTTVNAHRPITGVRTVLPVVARRTTAGGSRWLRVRVPGRPNGRTGWISAHAVRLGTTAYRITVDLSQRTVRVFYGGRETKRFQGVVGKASTPTPRGRFFVEETVDTGPSAEGGPYALALSARSNVLQEFQGGPGQIALHGRDNLGGTLGTAASHGCVRLSTPAITYLATHIRPGVPVTVRE